MKSIKLPRTLANSLLTHAQQGAPNESCGLVGQKESLFQAYPVDNIAAQAERVFEMHPQQQIAAMRAMRENGQTLFAIYHSHPTSPAQASKTDWERMNYDDVYYLIVSLNTVGVLEMKAYWPEDDNFTEVELEIG